MRLILLQQLRRDRVTLPIWILGTALLLTVVAASVVNEYGDVAGRAKILTVALATPALLALRGIPNGDSLGSAVHFQSYAFLAVTIGLMNVFLATRHGRADEEKGRRELVVATPIGRLAAPVATVILGVIANGAFAVIGTLGYLSAGLPVGGAVLTSVALGLTGLAFLGLTMLVGELVATSRAANGAGTVIVLAAYALRAAGDALGTPDLKNLTLAPAWPSALSPIGWGQQTFAFTSNRWWPVLAIAALAVLAVAAALAVHARRDLGASLLPERLGRSTRSRALGSTFGLAWRLQAPTLIAWTAGSALLGLLLGSLVTAIERADLTQNPQLTALLQSLGHTSQEDLARALIPTLMVLVGVMAAAAGVQAVLRSREEETDGRAELTLAGPVSRAGWLGSFALIGVISVLVVLAATGAASALGFAAIGNRDDAWLSLGQALIQAPAALVFVGAAVLMVGLLPRAAIALSWGLYGLGIAVGMFGQLLDLPKWARDISPITNVPALPTDEWMPTIVIAAIALVLTIVALGAFRRRDLTT